MKTLRHDDVATCTSLYGPAPYALTNRTLNWAEANFPDALQGGPSTTQGTSDGYATQATGSSL